MASKVTEKLQKGVVVPSPAQTLASRGVPVKGVVQAYSPEAQARIAEAEFRSQHVQLSTNEWVNRQEFEALPLEDQELLRRVGVAEFNRIQEERRAQAEAEQRAFEASHVKLDTNEWVKKTDWEALNAADQDLLRRVGVAEFNRIKQAEWEAFTRSHVQVGDPQDNEWVPVEQFNKLNLAEQYLLKKLGYSRYMGEMAKELAKSGVPFAQALRVVRQDVPQVPQVAVSSMFTADDIWQAQQRFEAVAAKYRQRDGTYDVLKIIQDNALGARDMAIVFGLQPDGSVSQEWLAKYKELLSLAHKKRLKQLRRELGGTAYKAAEVSRTYLDWTLPVYGTQRHWSKMPAWSKTLSVIADVFMLMPVVGGAFKGATKATVAVGKGAGVAQRARLAAAARETIWFTREGGQFVPGEFWRSVAWPAEVAGTAAYVVKPQKAVTGAVGLRGRAAEVGRATVGNIKSTLAPLENILRPSKLPGASVSVAYHSVKIPIKLFDNVDEALKAREALIREASKPGRYLRVDTKDAVIEFRRGALMSELGGYAHGTPSGRSFVEGAVVKYKPGLPGIEQGLYFSPEPLVRFTQDSAFQGMANLDIPGWVITSKKGETTRKIYRGAIEVESIHPVGTKIPRPKQILWTRFNNNGAGVMLMLDRKLTAKQILKLKVLGPVEWIKALYSPVVIIRPKAGLSPAKMKRLADIVAETNQEQAALLRRLAGSRRRLGVERSLMLARLRMGVNYKRGRARPLVQMDRIPLRRAVDLPRQLQRIQGRISLRQVPTAIGRGVTRAIATRGTGRAAVARPSARPSARVSRAEVHVEARELSRQALQGAVTWRQGQLRGRDVWITLYPPYRQQDVVYSLTKPEGVRQIQGPGSARKTAVVLRGPLVKAAEVDIGAFRARIKASGKGRARLSFVPELSKG